MAMGKAGAGESASLFIVVAVLALLALIGGGGYVVYTNYRQRGIRNNNPGNIRDNGTAWLGRVGNDGSFVIFDRPEHGIRALARTLATYQSKYGLRTVRAIITRWAPPSENDTEAYIAAVAGALGVDDADPIGAPQIPALVAAITQHENGVQPYPAALIAKGVSLA